MTSHTPYTLLTHSLHSTLSILNSNKRENLDDIIQLFYQWMFCRKIIFGYIIN